MADKPSYAGSKWKALFINVQEAICNFFKGAMMKRWLARMTHTSGAVLEVRYSSDVRSEDDAAIRLEQHWIDDFDGIKIVGDRPILEESRQRLKAAGWALALIQKSGYPT